MPGAIVIARKRPRVALRPGEPVARRAGGAPGARLVLMCDEGYHSSLAAATLHELGLAGATDLAGGFQAWRAAGLPVTRAG